VNQLAEHEIVENIAYIVFGFAVAYFLYISLGFIFNTNTPIVAVVSCSMVPNFYPGDLIVVWGRGEIKVNDIIVYDVATSKYPIIHRVIAINEDGSFQTKGDANPTQIYFEKRVNPKLVHGKAVLKIPLLGWVKLLAVSLIDPSTLSHASKCMF
jgi:signal peptidase I